MIQCAPSRVTITLTSPIISRRFAMGGRHARKVSSTADLLSAAGDASGGHCDRKMADPAVQQVTADGAYRLSNLAVIAA